MVLDTLAAGYAESEDFDAAVATAEQALKLIENREVPLARQIAARLELYRNGEPFREGRETSSP